jgi:2-hydroxy-6-oxonona-2,4-dienedioate hydrolase/4,5:9,10-diseco-3-hydroxy-5,9,17-trioxoandrosta-1(10),2-diene-4-oate hydrolase
MRDPARYIEAEERLWRSVGLAPKEHRIHLDHSGVDVRVQEVGEGPPVLFVHGASNSGTSWADLVVRLPGFRCLMLDRPGAGLSEPLPAPFEGVDALARFSETLIVDVLDALELGSVDVVATSYGGYAALRGAIAHPDRIRRMVIFGWTMGAGNPGFPWFMRLASTPVGRAMVGLPTNERVVRSMFKRIGLRDALASGRVSTELIECYLALLNHTDTMRNELEIGRWTMNWKGLNEAIVLSPDSLSRISTPVYFLWGEDDPFGPPEVARAFVDQIPNASLELYPGGHALWLDDPDHAAEITTRHLREVTDTPTAPLRTG